MRALVAYTAARCSRAQVWVAPWLAFVVLVALLDAPSGRAADALALNTIVLLFVAAWLTLATLGSEPPEQAGVLAAAVGGARRGRVAVLVAAACGGAALVPVSLVATWLESRDPQQSVVWAHGLTAPLVATALLAHVVAIVCGTVVAAAFTRPLVVSRTASLLLVAVVAVLLVVVPDAPVAVAVTRTAHPTLAGLGVTAVVAAVVVGVGWAIAWWTSGLVARRR